MCGRSSPLFDASRAALLLRVGPGGGPVPAATPLLNAIRVNDLSRRASPHNGTSSPATYGSTREPATWEP
jgi:hypothetical protein